MISESPKMDYHRNYQKPIHLKGKISDSQRFPLNLYLINIVEDIVVFQLEQCLTAFNNFLHRNESEMPL